MRRFWYVLITMILIIAMTEMGWGVTPYTMSSGDYTEAFTNISNTTNWPDGFNGTDCAEWSYVTVNSSGTIGDGVKTTVSTATFKTGTTGGIQRGSANIYMLSTSTANACAIDLYLDFTGRTAGTVSFDVATVFNSSGDRDSKLRLFYSTDGTSFTEITGTNLPFTARNNIASSASISVSLPSTLDGSSTARLRFYEHSTTTGATPTGSQPKISIDNIAITSTASSSATPPTLTADATDNNVDNNIDITFTDDATWRAAITAVKIGGTALTVTTDYVITSGNLQLKPSGLNSLLTNAGSKSVTVEATGYSTASVTQVISVGAAVKLGMKTQPAAPAYNGAVLGTQPAVYIQDQYGNTTTSTASVSAVVGAGSWTLGGTPTVSASAGTATFSGLTATSATAVTGATISFTSDGLTGVTSGTFDIPAPAPTLTVSTATLSGFTYGYGSGPSSEQTFTASGINLTNDISITASTNYEVSLTSGSGYTSPLTLTQSGGTVNATTIYVRLKAGLSVGSYSSEVINITSTDASEKTVTCSGSVQTALPLVEDFDYTATEDLTSHNWSVLGTNTAGNCVVSNSGLTFTGYAGSDIGNAGTITGASSYDEIGRSYVQQTTGSVYYAFLLNVSSNGSSEGYFTGLHASLSTTYNLRVFCGNSTSPYKLGLGISTTGSYATTPTNIDANTPVLVVIKYTIGGTAKLFIFTSEVPNTEPSTPEVELSGITSFNPGSVFIREDASSVTGTIDGIRIATNWAQAAAPTPTVAATNTITTGSNINQAFSSTNVTLSFGSVTTGANVTVNKYTTGPSNVSFSSSTPTSISNYRWIIDAVGLAFSDGTFKIAVSGLSGINDPSTVNIYKRSTPGTGAFDKLTTSYADGYLSATITSFSEFILGSDGDNSLPVSLTSFVAEPSGNAVVLSWRTESETENLGFIVQRQLRVPSSGLRVADWEEIASYSAVEALQGHGSTSEAHEYSFTDAAVVPGMTYSYRIADVDYSGTATWHSAVEVTVPESSSSVPTEFGLQKAFPNPFNPAVTLSYSLTKDARTSLKVYNVLGQAVATIVDTWQGSGNYSYTWQPQNLSAGIYLVRLESGNKTNLQKVVFVK